MFSNNIKYSSGGGLHYILHINYVSEIVGGAEKKGISIYTFLFVGRSTIIIINFGYLGKKSDYLALCCKKLNRNYG